MIGQRARRLMPRLAGVVLALLCVPGTALGLFTATPTVDGAVSTLRLDAPASASAVPMDGCATVVVSWDAAPHADAYRVEVTVDGGGTWQGLPAPSIGELALTDLTGYPAGTTVQYRVFAGHAASGWESAAAVTTPALACVG